MVIRNYVILEEGIPTRLHFIDHEISLREITDPITLRPKTVQALVFTVDRVDGVPTQAYYSTISQKHALQFQPYLEKKRYVNYEFRITMIGKGFRREYKVEVIPFRP